MSWIRLNRLYCWLLKSILCAYICSEKRLFTTQTHRVYEKFTVLQEGRNYANIHIYMHISIFIISKPTSNMMGVAATCVTVYHVIKLWWNVFRMTRHWCSSILCCICRTICRLSSESFHRHRKLQHHQSILVHQIQWLGRHHYQHRARASRLCKPRPHHTLNQNRFCSKTVTHSWKENDLVICKTCKYNMSLFCVNYYITLYLHSNSLGEIISPDVTVVSWQDATKVNQCYPFKSFK